jgi:prophage antirepressor-like protein
MYDIDFETRALAAAAECEVLGCYSTAEALRNLCSEVLSSKHTGSVQSHHDQAELGSNRSEQLQK